MDFYAFINTSLAHIRPLVLCFLCFCFSIAIFMSTFFTFKFFFLYHFLSEVYIFNILVICSSITQHFLICFKNKIFVFSHSLKTFASRASFLRKKKFFSFKIHVSKLMHFQEEKLNFFLKNEVLRSESID